MNDVIQAIRRELDLLRLDCKRLEVERDALKVDIDRRIRADENIRKRWKEYAEELKADAERYRKLRVMTWDSSPICVVRDPKRQLILGTDCPSHDRLDEALDSL